MAFDPSLITGASLRLRYRANILMSMAMQFQRIREMDYTLPPTVWVDGVQFTVTLYTPTAGGSTSQQGTFQAAVDAVSGPTILVVQPGGPYMWGSHKVLFDQLDDCYVFGHGARFVSLEDRNISQTPGYPMFEFNGCDGFGVFGLTCEMLEGTTTWDDNGTTRERGRSWVWREYFESYAKRAPANRIYGTAFDGSGTAQTNVSVPKDNGANYCYWFVAGKSGAVKPKNGILMNNSTIGGRGAVRFGHVDGFVIVGNHWRHTYSDCQHTQSGSQNGLIASNTILWSGDDGIPLVGYAAADSDNEVRNIIVERNTVSGTRSRGLVAHGTQNVLFRDNVVQQTLYCGIALDATNYEGNAGYSNNNIGFVRNQLYQCAMMLDTNGTVPRWFSHPIGIVGSPQGNFNCLIDQTTLHVLDEKHAIDGVTSVGAVFDIDDYQTWPAIDAAADDDGNRITAFTLIDQRSRGKT